VWQIGKTAFRNTLAGCTATIHEHLDDTVSIRYGPHGVGRYDAQGQPIQAAARKRAAGAESGISLRQPGIEIGPFPVSPSGGTPGAHRHSLRSGG
jgi:hypothetical protein